MDLNDFIPQSIGLEQSDKIYRVSENFKSVASLILRTVQPGEDREAILRKLLEAKMTAVNAISHEAELIHPLDLAELMHDKTITFERSVQAPDSFYINGKKYRQAADVPQKSKGIK